MWLEKEEETTETVPKTLAELRLDEATIIAIKKALCFNNKLDQETGAIEPGDPLTGDIDDRLEEEFERTRGDVDSAEHAEILKGEGEQAPCHPWMAHCEERPLLPDKDQITRFQVQLRKAFGEDLERTDGEMDEKMRQAIKRFKQDHNLAEDFRVDQETVNALNAIPEPSGN